jgi:hypothetical protein
MADTYYRYGEVGPLTHWGIPQEIVTMKYANFAYYNTWCPKKNFLNIHIYHLRFIPEGVAEAPQIFLQDAHVLSKLFSCE